MRVFSVILHNLLGFDLLILLVGALNGWLYLAARRAADRLYDTLHLKIFVPSRRGEPQTVSDSVRAVDEEEIVALRKRSESLYSVFSNVTAIFPLLGILGTVVSLLPMVADLADMQQNFFAALTSTFWGLVFAIAFKLLDGFLAARIEDNDKSVALFLERYDPAREDAAL